MASGAAVWGVPHVVPSSHFVPSVPFVPPPARPLRRDPDSRVMCAPAPAPAGARFAAARLARLIAPVRPRARTGPGRTSPVRSPGPFPRRREAGRLPDRRPLPSAAIWGRIAGMSSMSRDNFLKCSHSRRCPARRPAAPSPAPCRERLPPCAKRGSRRVEGPPAALPVPGEETVTGRGCGRRAGCRPTASAKTVPVARRRPGSASPMRPVPASAACPARTRSGPHSSNVPKA